MLFLGMLESFVVRRLARGEGTHKRVLVRRNLVGITGRARDGWEMNQMIYTLSRWAEHWHHAWTFN
jgi:hypothetical protein